MQKIDFIRYLTGITSLNCICYRTIFDPESGATDYEIVAGHRMLKYEAEFSASGVKISEAASDRYVMRWLNMVVSDLQKQHLNKSIRCVKISNVFYIVTIFCFQITCCSAFQSRIILEKNVISCRASLRCR
jgi:hypothetical protein